MPYPVALIELGLNAVRLLLAQIIPGLEYRILPRARAQTRLGSGSNGHLSPRAVRDTLQTVHGFLLTLPRDGSLKVLAVATAAVRDAGARASSSSRFNAGTPRCGA